MNGALTIGTLDGANVEIREAVGAASFFLFGLTTEEVAARRRAGYVPADEIAANPDLAEALALIESGFFSLGEPKRFQPIVDSLRHHDRYLICADFSDYVATEGRAADVFRNQIEWARRAVLNIAGASDFSADDTIRKYAAEILGLQPVPVDSRFLSDAV